MATKLISQVLPSFPYPPPGTGYWGPQTSTINWCEEDYYATIYAAEIVNTLTNLLFAALAIRGIANCIRHGHDSMFIVTFLGYGMVGLGSFCFHGSLKYAWQMVDENGMLYTTMFSLFASFTWRRSTTFRIFFAIFLFSLAVFVTAYYHFIQDPTFHQQVYAALTATVLFRSMFLMETSLRPTWKAYFNPIDRAKLSPIERAELARQDARDSVILKTMWTMFGYGLSVFLGGFAIWQLDNIHCSTIRAWRHEIGLPWGILLEGHGWWHIMTGVGAYTFIVWGVWLRHCLNGDQEEFELLWPSIFYSLPLVVRKDKIKAGAANGHGANGHALNGNGHVAEQKKTK